MPNTAKTSMPRQHDPLAQPLNCSIFITDIVGYSDLHRDDYDRAVLRSTLRRILTDTFMESGLSWRKCHHHDRGDGLLTVVPPTLSTSLLIEPLLPLLSESIRRRQPRCHGSTAAALGRARRAGCPRRHRLPERLRDPRCPHG